MQHASDEIDRILDRARKHYDVIVGQIEDTDLGRYICINAETGEYELGDSIREVGKKYERRFGSAPAWLTRVGYPDSPRAC